MLGGTWGLYTDGVRDEVATTGTRVVAAVVVVLLVAAVLVVLARVGLWRQAFVSERMMRLFAWALAAVFLLETLAAFTWSRGEELWWMYGPVSLVIAVLALVVAGSGAAWPRLHRTAPDAALSLKETSWPRELFHVTAPAPVEASVGGDPVIRAEHLTKRFGDAARGRRSVVLRSSAVP